MVCRYTVTGADGRKLTLVGKKGLAEYLANGGLEHLLPERAASLRRTPISKAVSAIGNEENRQNQVYGQAMDAMAGWENKPNLVVAKDVWSLPENTKEQREAKAKIVAKEEAYRAEGGTIPPDAFYMGGTVYLFHPMLPSEHDVMKAMFHEGLGHYGLRGLYGDGLNSVLEQIIALRKKDVLAKAKSYKIDTSTKNGLLEAAEEVLAEMAETQPNIGYVQRAIAAIRTWLRQNVPGFSKLELSDAEIVRDYLLPARAFVQRGAQAGRYMADAVASRRDVTATEAFKKWFGNSKVVDAEGKPLVVYHGTNADFSTFENRSRETSRAAPSDLGNWFTSGSDYAAVHGGAVMPVFLTLKNPKAYSSEDFHKLVDGGENFAALRDKLEAQRFDGVVVAGKKEKLGRFDVESPANFVAFRPEQIKSATGNNGDFDASNPDIRFSRAAPKETGLVLPEQGMLRRVQAAMQDSFNRVKQVQERIQELTGKTLAESANYYMAEANRPGRIAARKEDFERSIIQPLMEKLAKSGFKPEQLAELLHAMHAEERNESRGKLHPEDSDYYRAMTEHDIVGASGMSTNKAKEIIAKYKGARELHKLANDARQITKMTLDLQLASNRISKEDYDALNDAYEFYVPLKGDGEYGPTIKRAIGHGERDEFILENIKRDYELAVVAGEKNLARMPFLRMVLENPDDKLWSVGVPPKGRYIAGTVFSIRKGGVEEAAFTSQAQVSAFLEAKGSAAGQYEVFAGNEKAKEFTKPLQDNEVMVYLEGQPVRIQINGDEQLARQLRPLDRGQMNVILEQMRSLNRWLSKVYTGYNPAFIIRNTVRDALTGTINIMGNEGAGTAAKAWANYPGALKAMGQYAATGKAPDSEMGKYLNEYRMHGGKTGASWLSDLEAQGADLQRMFDDAYGASGYLKDGKTGKAAWIAGRKIVGGMAHVVEVMNQATENGLRLALYVAMRKQGKSAGEAAQAAKSVTVDFDRKGSMTGALGAIYLFFNPAVQGTANAIKTLAKGRHKEQAWAALGALALLGMYAAGSGMDDDKDRWLGEGWESRSKNFILNIGGNHIKLPVSLEFAPFYGFGVALAEAMRGESKVSSAVRMMSSVIDAYFPLNGVFSPESDNHAMDAAMALVPTALKPGLEIAANRNSFGSQVYPENEYTKDRPDNQKMFRGTKGSAYDAAAQGIAKAGEAIGFGRYENDITKVSPETLKMLWRTYTGGLGQFVTDAAGLASLSSQGATELSDVPIVKDFFKPNDVKAIRGRFYDLAKDVRAAASEFSIAKKAGDGEAMDAILSRPEKAELLGLDVVIKKTQRATAALRDEMVDVSSDQTLSTAQKRARLKELEVVEEDMYRAAIGAFK